MTLKAAPSTLNRGLSFAIENGNQYFRCSTFLKGYRRTEYPKLKKKTSLCMITQEKKESIQATAANKKRRLILLCCTNSSCNNPALKGSFSRYKTSKNLTLPNKKVSNISDGKFSMASALIEEPNVAFNPLAPLVKMCGITSTSDALLAVQAGAKFIGMILWPKSKRSISLDVAKEISRVVKKHGAEPVGVFVEEAAMEIERACVAADINFAQLHSDKARSALSRLEQHRQIIYVLHADEEGNILTPPPPKEYLVDWILIDSIHGGSGKSFDWQRLHIPKNFSKHGWLLAGGLNPENVSDAFKILRPNAVDVSSGICGSDGIHKDPKKISLFMNAVRQMS